MTWREYGTAVAAVVSDVEGIDPPAALRGYYSASEQAIQIVLTAIEDQPPDDQVNLFALMGIAVLAAGIIDTAVAALPPALQAQLEAAGCWEPSGWEISVGS